MPWFYCFYADITKSKSVGSLRGFQASAVQEKKKKEEKNQTKNNWKIKGEKRSKEMP